MNTPTAKRTADQLRGDYGETVYEQLKSSPLWTLLATNREIDDLGSELGVKVFAYVEKLIDAKVEEIADEAMRLTEHLEVTR